MRLWWRLLTTGVTLDFTKMPVVPHVWRCTYVGSYTVEYSARWLCVTIQTGVYDRR